MFSLETGFHSFILGFLLFAYQQGANVASNGHFLYVHFEGRKRRKNTKSIKVVRGKKCFEGERKSYNLNKTSERSVLFIGCSSNEFECACGLPRCIPNASIKDGTPHCQDASDETKMGDALACPDGTPSRRGPLRNKPDHRFQPCNMSNPCLREFGQVCLVTIQFV